MKCSSQRKDTMHFFSLHLLRENDTVKSLKMAVAVTKYRYITFQVELSNLNSTRLDSVVKETDSIRFFDILDSLNIFFNLFRLASVRLSRTESNCRIFGSVSESAPGQCRRFACKCFSDFNALGYQYFFTVMGV